MTFHDFIALIPAVFVMAWVLGIFTKSLLGIFYNIGVYKKDD